MTSQIHAIAKGDPYKHIVVDVAPSKAPLAEGSVRVQARIASMTMLSKVYAVIGHVLHWWDAFPIPAHAPAPYNDTESWGIIPSWGYGEVIESKDRNLPVGTLLYGQWVTASLPFDMTFKPSSKEGHFIEISEHRQRLINLNNHFEIHGADESEELKGWYANAMTLFAAGWLIPRFCFPTGDTTPVGVVGQTGTDWTREDADLSSTVFVSLAALSKTARGLSWGFAERESGKANYPLGFIEVASRPDNIPGLATDKFAYRAASYDDLTTEKIVGWIGHLKPTHIYVIDFGAKPGAVQAFHDTIMGSDAAPSRFDLLEVGANRQALETTDSRTTKTLWNASAIMDTASVTEGLDAVYDGRKSAFEKWLDAKGMGTMTLKWGDGLSGEEGFEGAYDALMHDKLPSDKALAFRI